MSDGTESSAHTLQARLRSPAMRAPALRPMRFDDYDNVRTLLSAHGLGSPTFEDWSQRWVDNPVWQRLGATTPTGWVLESPTGEIVGSMESIPTSYKFQGADLIAGISAAWCSRASYRGYALQLIDEFFNQSVDLFIGTTVGPASVEALSQFYGPVPLGRWDTTSYFVTGHVSLARRALRKFHVSPARALAYPLGYALAFKDALFNTALPESPRDVLIETTDTFDERFDAFWSELLRENPEKLLAERNSRALSWHFGAALRSNRLRIFTASKNGRLCGYCVLRQESAAGDRSLRLIDYQSVDPERDLLPGFLRAALRICTAEGFYMLQNYGVGVPKMRVFDTCAPYRGKLPNPVFFYGAADAKLQAELREPRLWDPSLFDGDAAL